MLTLDRLCDLLATQGLISPELARDLKVRAPAARLRMLKQRAGTARGRAADVSPAEAIASLQAQTLDGRPLNEDRVAEALAKAASLPYLKLDPLKLDPKTVTESMSRAFTRHNIILPIQRDGQRLTLSIDDPFDAPLLDSLKRMLPSPPAYVVSSRADILRILTEFHGFRSSVAAAASDIDAQSDLGNLEQLVALKSVEELEANDAHIVRAVEYMLHYAFGQRASDIHIEPKREQTLLRLRIDGLLHTIHQMPKAVHLPLISRLKSLARMDIAEKRRPQDGRIKTQIQGREIELRVSSLPVAFGEKLVIRILDPLHLMQDLPSMGMGSDELSRFQGFLSQKTGLILVTGPTGSGKTSTLYSSLRALYSPTLNIVTAEDPIEMVYEPFNQVQVQPKIGLDFAETLRHVLRQDPDVIMVGEIRDEETAQIAMQAALTGHLVLSTLHTNDAPSAIARLFDLGIKPFLISSALLGVVAQRLVRKVCVDCRAEAFLSEEQLSLLDIKLPPRSTQRRLPVKEGQGCAACRYTGLQGRTAIFEVMPVNENIRRLIQQQAPSVELLKAARADGMLTLREVAIRKMAQGETSFEEVIGVVGTSGGAMT
jgi:general secretion pathway protein E